MKQYQFTSIATVDSVIEQLVNYGITIIPGYLSKDIVTKLKENFSRVFSEELECIIRKYDHPTNPEGRQATINPLRANQEGMPEFAQVFHSNFMHEIVQTYFAPYSVDLNPAVLLNHLKPSPIPILPWHFDRQQTLKFWIYLQEATHMDGAFEYCPGTHWEGRYRAAYHLATGSSIVDLPNDIPDHRIQNPVTLEAQAGDLIIFDPDGFHRGGVVQDGRERLVLRADSWPKDRRRWTDIPGSSAWWLQTPLNMASWLKPHAQRILGDRIQDSSINRKDHDISNGKE